MGFRYYPTVRHIPTGRVYYLGLYCEASRPRLSRERALYYSDDSTAVLDSESADLALESARHFCEWHASNCHSNCQPDQWGYPGFAFALDYPSYRPAHQLSLELE